MGIMVSKSNEENSRLNDRIAADLRARAAETERGQDPDLVEDSDYAKDLKTTGKYTWIWVVLVILAIISIVVMVMI
ncbi:hypothetical protein IKE07_02370 [Candidatus Saccharibacteria bacterium]|nr:hypothetical protein [Candidatus Saccharibacteria bacterium]